jgi:hypothetical protein
MRFRAMLNEIAQDPRARISSTGPSCATALRRAGQATIHASWARDPRAAGVAQIVISVLAFATALLLARADALNAGLT